MGFRGIIFKEIEREVAELLGEEYSTRLVENIVNGKELIGIAIKCKNNLEPVIYVKEDKIEGLEIEEIAQSIVDTFKNQVEIPELDMSWITDYEKVKEHIFLEIVETERNRKLLENVPHKDFEKLSAIPYILVDEFGDGTGKITVKNELVNVWEADTEELFVIGAKNIQKEGYELANMIDVVHELMLEAGMDPEVEEAAVRNPMWILSNKSRRLGAQELLNPDAIKDIEQRFGECWIIPSSRHEVIIIPKEYEPLSKEIIREMIRETNQTEVSYEDILTDDLYELKDGVWRIAE